MGELGLNKIFGAILAAALLIMGLQAISATAFSSGEHHGGHHGEEKPYGEAIKDKYAYWTNVSVDSAASVEEGPVYDLGLLLASADADKGARVFKSVCSSCHTIEQGGANGTGPNLHGLVGRDIATASGFDGYSGALSGVEGDWTYAQLDSWIEDPKNIARGVNMVANVKKDPDRANLIAYLASNTPGAAAFPAPLPAETDAPAEGEAPAEGVVEPALLETGGENAGGTDVTVEGVLVPVESVEAPVVGVDRPLEEVADPVAIAEDIVEGATEAVPSDIIEAVEDAATDIVEDVTEAAGGIEMPEAPVVPDLEPAEVVEPPH